MTFQPPHTLHITPSCISANPAHSQKHYGMLQTKINKLKKKSVHMHTNKPAHLKIPNTSILHTHTFSQWTAWLVLGSVGKRRWKRRRRLHLCRKVGCLAASSGRSAIHPSHPSLLPSTRPLTPLPPPPTFAPTLLPPSIFSPEPQTFPSCFLSCEERKCGWHPLLLFDTVAA